MALDFKELTFWWGRPSANTSKKKPTLGFISETLTKSLYRRLLFLVESERWFFLFFLFGLEDNSELDVVCSKKKTYKLWKHRDMNQHIFKVEVIANLETYWEIKHPKCGTICGTPALCEQWLWTPEIAGIWCTYQSGEMRDIRCRGPGFQSLFRWDRWIILRSMIGSHAPEINSVFRRKRRISF